MVSTGAEHGGRGAAPQSGMDERRGQEESERIATLLDEVRSMAGQPTWQRVEELVQRLVGLYGEGLERLLGIVADAGALDERVESAIGGDELVSSLLVLHGLHPLPTQERVERALDEVRPYLGSHAGDVELLGVDDDGVARLKLLGTCHGCPSSRATLESTIWAAIEARAPEIVRIEVDGAQHAAAQEPGLVQLDPRRASLPGGGPGRWIPLDAIEPPSEGQTRSARVLETGVLIANVGGAMLAYRNACAACGSPLDSAALTGACLTCVQCGASFDVVRAGRAAREGGRALEPIPLLADARGVRLLLREASA